jgi:hypothetical protein
MKLLLKDGRLVGFDRLGVYEIYITDDGEELRRYIGHPTIKIEDIEKVL